MLCVWIEAVWRVLCVWIEAVGMVPCVWKDLLCEGSLCVKRRFNTACGKRTCAEDA